MVEFCFTKIGASCGPAGEPSMMDEWCDSDSSNDWGEAIVGIFGSGEAFPEGRGMDIEDADGGVGK